MKNTTELVVDPPFQRNWEWEKFDYFYWRDWMEARWWWSVVLSLIYIVIIFGGRRLMKEREAYKLRKVLLAWNIMLAIYSGMSVSRTGPDLWNLLRKENGLHNSICSGTPMTMTHVFWEFVGTWSKALELGDTIFIVLRKQPLIFLHWYHHTSVLVYTWFSIDANDPAHRYYMVMNMWIHALMYSYYALRILGVKIPRGFAICLTSMQIIQMFVGFFINVYTFYVKAFTRAPCDRRDSNINFALLMYGSYLLLFTNFFYNSYFKSRPKQVLASKKME